jgi:hypothetical protein
MSADTELYAVVSAEGLTLLINMSRDDALALQESGTYPPAGSDPGVCYAVPMHTAEIMQSLWSEYDAGFKARCREARIVRMREVATSYDAASADRV